MALGGGRRGDEEIAALDLEVVARHAILLEAGLSRARYIVKLPAMPRTNDEFVIETPLAERAADVVASSGDSTKHAVSERQGDPRALEHDFAQRGIFECRGRTEIDPACRAVGVAVALVHC